LKETTMDDPNLKPEHDLGAAGDQLATVPALTTVGAAIAARRGGASTGRLRRRFRATRPLFATDNGLRPFRIY
jgi:hypothetical protein